MSSTTLPLYISSERMRMMVMMYMTLRRIMMMVMMLTMMILTGRKADRSCEPLMADAVFPWNMLSEQE